MRKRVTEVSALGLVLLVTCVAASVSAKEDEEPETAQHGSHLDQLAEAIARADKAMSSVKRRDLETTNFQISTDVLSDTVLNELAASLEGAFYTIDQVLDLPIHDTDRKVKVYFFEQGAQHYETLGWSRGAYLSPGLLTFYKGKSGSQELMDVLVHEATHAFLDCFIVHREVQFFPPWINEGFASYMGYSFIVDREIRPGVFYATQRLEFLNGVAFRPAPAARAADRVARRIKRGPLIHLDELVTADRSTFYGGSRSDYYDLAWAFVHYLRDGFPDGNERFSRLMAAVARGVEPGAAFEEAYRSSPDELEQPLHDYVTKILAKPAPLPR